jgi:hypothetical protein
VLQLTAADIFIVSAELLARFDSLSPAEREAALRTGTGTVDPRGFAEAGTIRLRVGNSVAVQNTGSIAQFGGLTTGAGGLVVERSGSTPITATLFGTQLSGGQASGGEAFFRATFGEGAPGRHLHQRIAAQSAGHQQRKSDDRADRSAAKRGHHLDPAAARRLRPAGAGAGRRRGRRRLGLRQRPAISGRPSRAFAK